MNIIKKLFGHSIPKEEPQTVLKDPLSNYKFCSKCGYQNPLYRVRCKNCDEPLSETAVNPFTNQHRDAEATIKGASLDLSAEQQQALCMSLQKLQYIALGTTRVTLPGETSQFEISQQTARWAMPYAERILDAVELFQRSDIRGALFIFLSLPEAAIVQMNIGVCYMELGERQEAESWLNKSARAMPPSRQGMLEENLRRLKNRE